MIIKLQNKTLKDKDIIRAANARKWKHRSGGILLPTNPVKRFKQLN